jgi:lipopolysaccharide transport system permease protein
MINKEVVAINSDVVEFPPTATGGLYSSPETAREPSVKIRPGRAPLSSELKEAFAQRELLYFFIWRDLKVRYKQTVLGAAWVILQPLLMALVFAIFMGMLARVPSDGLPYAVFAYAGLLPWVFFSNSVSSCSQCLTINNHLLTKVYFPRILLPLVVIGVRLVDFFIAFSVLILLMLYYRLQISWGILVFPLLVAQVALLSLGIGMWTAALNTRYRDVGVVLPVLLQLWMFLSPVVYPSSLVPEGWRVLYYLNPMAGIIEGMRSSLLGLEFNWVGLSVSAVLTLFSFLCFIYHFCSKQDELVDII